MENIPKISVPDNINYRDDKGNIVSKEEHE